MRSSARSFRRWDMPPGLAPSVMFGSDPGPGIYVLEFADGSEYVAQSIHPITRLATHRRRFGDIVAVRFTSVDRTVLDVVERAIITGRRNDGVQLRNRTLMSQPLGESAVDAIVSQEEQAAWIAADFTDAEVCIATERVEPAQAPREVVSQAAGVCAPVAPAAPAAPEWVNYAPKLRERSQG